MQYKADTRVVRLKARDEESNIKEKTNNNEISSERQTSRMELKKDERNIK